MASKYKNALKDITNILYTNESSEFYSAELIVSGMREYLSEFIGKESSKTTWKTRDSLTFKEDLLTMDVTDLAEKYDLTYQGAKYHKDKLKGYQKKIN